MNIAVVLAGGMGLRLGADVPKQYQLLAGKPVLIHTVEQFQRCSLVEHVVVVAEPGWKRQILAWKETFGLDKLCMVAPAGPDRQGSILNGLAAAEPLGADEVIVQDAARPLTSTALIEALLRGLEEAPCVMPALPTTDTLYLSRDGERVDDLLERSRVYVGQAPEAFHYDAYLKLYRETPPEKRSAMSGSSQLPHQAGWKVKIIPGEVNNIKITYPYDLALCEKLLRERGEGQ